MLHFYNTNQDHYGMEQTVNCGKGWAKSDDQWHKIIKTLALHLQIINCINETNGIFVTIAASLLQY